jgi:flagellar hook-associated protein 1 FlgK
MSGLNTALVVAMQSLLAQQGALDATTNNIANVNTPGYAREVPIFSEAPATQAGNLFIGNGVLLQQFQSVRDQVLEQRILQLTLQNSDAQAQTNSLQQVETSFTSSGSDIGSEMSAFFNSLTQLQSDPGNIPMRQGTLTAGQNLANAFHVTASGIAQVQAGLNLQVTQDVQQINQLAQQIAPLSAQVSNLKAAGQDGGTVEDQLHVLLGKLSALTDVTLTQTESGLTLTTGTGTALVVGGTSFALQTQTGSDGTTRVLDANGNDLTSTIQHGELGATIAVRDTTLPGITSQLNTLASQFADAFNAAHQGGFDLNGQPGGVLLDAPSTGSGAAANFGAGCGSDHAGLHDLSQWRNLSFPSGPQHHGRVLQERSPAAFGQQCA